MLVWLDELKPRDRFRFTEHGPLWVKLGHELVMQLGEFEKLWADGSQLVYRESK